MNEPTNVMDVVVENNGRTHVGVVDYSTTKHIIFFDFTTSQSRDVIMAVIVWRMMHENIRFSVFVNDYCPALDIGVPVLINKKEIKSGFDNTPLSKPKRKVLKKFTNQMCAEC